MNDRVTWKEYKGKKILFVDASGLSAEEYLKVVLEYEKTALPFKDQKSQLVLLDITDSYANREIVEKQKELAKLNISHKAAILGVTGIKKVIAQTVTKAFYFAKSEDDALEWLVKP